MGEKLRGLEEKRTRVKEKLAEVGDMRQGTISERYLKCGKAGCLLGIKEAERSAKKLGCEIALDEKSVTECTIPPVRTMYLGMDGTGLPLRKEELIDWFGKEPYGSAKTLE